MRLKLYITNTDKDRYNETDFMGDAIHDSSRYLAACPCSTAEVLTFPDAPWDGAFGYDYTQYAFDHVMRNVTWNKAACKDLDQYVIFTNGDNLFNANVFMVVMPFMDKRVDAIGYSFVSHHEREGMLNSVIKMSFTVNNVDLSSVIYSRRILARARRRHKLSFVPRGPKTEWMYGRDWYFLNDLLTKTHNVTTAVAPGVLLFHQ